MPRLVQIQRCILGNWPEQRPLGDDDGLRRLPPPRRVRVRGSSGSAFAFIIPMTDRRSPQLTAFQIERWVDLEYDTPLQLRFEQSRLRTIVLTHKYN